MPTGPESSGFSRRNNRLLTSQPEGFDRPHRVENRRGSDADHPAARHGIAPRDDRDGQGLARVAGGAVNGQSEGFSRARVDFFRQARPGGHPGAVDGDNAVPRFEARRPRGKTVRQFPDHRVGGQPRVAVGEENQGEQAERQDVVHGRPRQNVGDAFVPGLGEKFAGVPVRLGFGAGLHFAGHAHFTAERDPGHAITGFPPLKAEHFQIGRASCRERV